MDEVIVLTGFMGAGKSAVARQLSRRLGWRMEDLDGVIETQAGATVAEIFEMEGEMGFRDRETRALGEILAMERVVVAAGGGILGREENRRLLEGRFVVNLDAPFEVLFQRIQRGGDKRPLARGGEEHLRRLFESRKPLYRAVRRQVETAGRSPSEVAGEIARLYFDEAGEERES